MTKDEKSTVRNFQIVAYLAIAILAGMCFYQEYARKVGADNKVRAIIQSYSLGYQQGSSDAEGYYAPIIQQLMNQLMNEKMESYK